MTTDSHSGQTRYVGNKKNKLDSRKQNSVSTAMTSSPIFLNTVDGTATVVRNTSE